MSDELMLVTCDECEHDQYFDPESPPGGDEHCEYCEVCAALLPEWAVLRTPRGDGSG